MKNQLFVILLLLFFAALANAYEAPLSNFGFDGTDNNTNGSRACKELTISLPQEAINEKGEGILSLKGVFVEPALDNTFVSVSINGGEEKIYWHESFNCAQGECWARVFVPDLKAFETKVNLCLVLGGKTKSASIEKESYVGIYNTPVLSIRNSAPQSIYLGNRAEMRIIVENNGTKDADVFVQFIHPDTRAIVPITSFDIVEGESSASAKIFAGETKQFVYYIKPSLLSSYNLPSAALFFTNVFGENQVLISNHPLMSVVTPKRIELTLVSIEENNTKKFKAIIKNNWQTEFSGIITLSPQTEVLSATKELIIAPNSEKEILFEALPLNQGNYSFFATIRDRNQIYSSNKIDVSIQSSQMPVELIVSILGIIIGAIIFAWIYFISEEKK